MKRLFLCLLIVGIVGGLRSAEAAKNLLPNPELRAGADGKPLEWTLFSPRPALAVEGTLASDGGAPALSLHAGRYESFGKWHTLVNAVEPGKFYRLEVDHRTENVKAPGTSVLVVMSWFSDPEGTDEIQRDYVMLVSENAKWVTSARTLQAPKGTRSLRVEFGLRLAAGGTVWWKQARLTEAPTPASRKVRIAATRILPKIEGATIEGNTALMMKMFDQVGPERPDVVLFSENLATRFVLRPLKERAQTIPGPLTDLLAAKAKQYHTYAIATLLEANGDLYHNTAVLIDREGKIVGKYRKVHLTINETENGLTPGEDYPVFQTDFARIGIMTCWDNWFSESARALRLKGAEVLFMPLAGDSDPLHWDNVWKARAIDNGIWMVTSATVTDAPSQILNPHGEVVAEANGDFARASAEVDLNQEWRQKYLAVRKGLGEAATFFIQERRADTYSGLEKGFVRDGGGEKP